ncbi:uncharacterized protein cubi_02698 [Cryptosporidium ubiquitum]|uniref:Uncharacterized protein n=1 Tax=Cryptosporidium ubiquitum TaxID=857276 RepID=A0A1J4MI60_9CRYT|nr:uncharacterized protein cubi_02698 [Cryptosporidium ubiquitum]OII73896.1 hypothetical protein cubi_02698 [Cryptosporidium ubiquitum]
MQSSKTITEQFEELIKKAKTLNKTHPIIPEENVASKKNDLVSVKTEISMLQKRHDMCVVQKNAIRDLIKLHKEELQLLESALRTIESEEKKILEIIFRETLDNDSLTKTTSVEMVERDNDSLHAKSVLTSQNVSTSTTYENLDYEAPKNYADSNYENSEYLNNENSHKKESDSEESNDYSDDYSEQDNLSPKHTVSRRINSDRMVRFSMDDLKISSETKSNPAPKSNSTNLTNTARSSNSIKGVISIPQRYNYIRNRNSSLMKEISIKKILEGNRKLETEEKDEDQRALVRKLHTLYASKR